MSELDLAMKQMYQLFARELPNAIKRANEGEVRVQYTLGEMYMNGYGVEVDPVEALKWFIRAAHQDHVDAQWRLYEMYWKGVGCRADREEAERWCLRAAQLGHARAQHNMGVILYKKENGNQSLSDARKWFQLAAEQGIMESQHNLACIYADEEFEGYDLKLAEIWLNKAAAQGYEPSIELLKNLGMKKKPEFEISQKGELMRYNGRSGRVVIPQEVSKINVLAFRGCTHVTYLEIHEGVKSAPYDLIHQCSALTHFKAPGHIIEQVRGHMRPSVSIQMISTQRADTVFDIKSGVLKGYRGAGGSLVIPEGVTVIGAEAFKGQHSVTEVTFPESLETVEEYAFFDSGVRKITFAAQGNLKKIEHAAFYNCPVTELDLPASLTEVYGNAFAGCSLERITLQPGNTVYRCESNCLIRKEGQVLILGAKKSMLPGNVSAIGVEAFSGRKNMDAVTIPESVEYIGDWAFSSAGLHEVFILNPDAEMGEHVFSGCPLESVKAGRAVLKQLKKELSFKQAHKIEWKKL